MKHLIIFIACLFLYSCKDDKSDIQYGNETVTACGIKNPQKNLPWLKELIKKAETDKTGNYMGTIWLVKHNGREFFVTNMKFGSGGILYWIFDCSGNHYSQGTEHCVADDYIESNHFFLEDGGLPPLQELKLDVVIYSNIPFFNF